MCGWSEHPMLKTPLWCVGLCYRLSAAGRMPAPMRPQGRRQNMLRSYLPGLGLSAAVVAIALAIYSLVYDGPSCVRWCQFGPTDELPRIKHQRAYRESLGELPDWRITCFFVDRG